MIDFIIYIIEWLFGGFFRKNTSPDTMQAPTIITNHPSNQSDSLETNQLSPSNLKEPVIPISGTPNTKPLKPTAITTINPSPYSIFSNTNLLVGNLKSNTKSAFNTYSKNKLT